MLHIILHVLLALTANQRNKKKTWGPFQVLIFFSIDYYGGCNFFEIVKGTSLHQCRCAISLLEGDPNKRLTQSDIVCNELNQVVGLLREKT